MNAYFGGARELHKSIVPEHAVAIGTAIQAGFEAAAWPLPSAAFEL